MEQTEQITNRKVGFWLMVGIIFVPILFAWMLLNKGYSATARVLGFGWMLTILFVMVSSNNTEHIKNSEWYTSDVEMFSLNIAPYEYKDDIKERLRDPKSFELISVDYYIVDSSNYKATKEVLKSYKIKPKIDSTMMVFINYRARNGFGGLNVGMATFVVTPTSRTFLEIE